MTTILKATDLGISFGGLRAVDGLDMTIEKGELYGLIGPNGAGKTTLIKLLMRLYDPTEGEILYNGKNIKEYTVSSIRKHMAAVFQDYRIFACSLAENIAAGPYADTMEPDVNRALHDSTLADKLQSLPQGIQTQLTREFDNCGTQLSGGEQQKVAIARAFYKNADLIILDEPSSALDPIAEYEMYNRMIAACEDCGVIFISHRLSSAVMADRIYLLENGRVAECGTHTELMEKNGRYAEMFKKQAMNYAEV